jgi:multicomponent K+:H+ antiporter subunit E
MKRWLPFPVVSLALCALWLMLNQSFDPASLLFGAALGIAAPLLARRLQPSGYPRLRAPLTFARLMAMASVEIVRSCYGVCRIILSSKSDAINAQFIHVPLTLRDPHGLALLSCLINMTPGTVWVELLPGHVLSLHVFDLHDAPWWVETIQQRYEQPLIEIFETEGDNGKPA